MKDNLYNYCLASLLLTLSIHAVQGQEQNDEYIFHYSVLSALNDKVFTGDLQISELKKHGDLGLGTYNYLDGEMVIIDGTVYKVYPDGEIVEADNKAYSPYAMITNFDAEKSMEVTDIAGYAEFQELLLKQLPSRNIFYAFRIRGTFRYLKTGTVSRQNRPFTKRLKEILDDRPVYEAKNTSGTMVDLWCPDYMIDINAPGFHLHFIADDKSIGGHLLELEIERATVEIDVIRGYRMQLQDSEEFDNTKLRLNDPENNY